MASGSPFDPSPPTAAAGGLRADIRICHLLHAYKYQAPENQLHTAS
jgi:hypothetical protein